MANIEHIKQEVRKLPRYGVHITGLTPTGAKAMPKIVFNTLRRKFGLWGCLVILFKSWFRGKRVVKQNPKAYQRLKEYSEHSARELPVLFGMFLVVSERMGNRRRAYDEVFKKIIEEDAIVSMPDLYEVDELEKFEDPYEAFKEYNYGLFLGEENFPIDEFVDDGDHFHFRVQKCIQTELAKAFGVDELAEVGCDHDCAGYPFIEDRVNAVFRRPQTIAKGDEYCDFNFYRKGTEPQVANENK